MDLNLDLESDWWKEAIRQRAEEAEAKFQANGKVNDMDMVAVALSRPDSYEIDIRLRQA